MLRFDRLFGRCSRMDARAVPRPSRSHLRGPISLDTLESRTLLSNAYFVPPGTPADSFCADKVTNGRDTLSRSHTSPNGHAGYDRQLSQFGDTSVPIPAAEAGKVVRADGLDSKGYGNVVVVQYADGTTQLFAHLASSSVKVGDRVSQGEAIGIQGNSGHSVGPTGVHLHTEVGSWDPKAGRGHRMVRNPDPNITRKFVDEYVRMLEQGRFQGQCLHSPIAVPTAPMAPAVNPLPSVISPPSTTPSTPSSDSHLTFDDNAPGKGH